jgi:hypothetical protein
LEGEYSRERMSGIDAAMRSCVFGVAARCALAVLCALAAGGCMALHHGAGVEPAIVELEVTPWEAHPDDEVPRADTALYYAAHFQGPYAGKLDEIALEQDGRTVAVARPRNEYVSPQGDSYQRIGAGQMDDAGGLVMRAAPDLLLAGVEPGRYTLALRFRSNLALPLTSRIPVELVRLPSTSGHQLAVSPASHIDHATIRFETESVFGERSRAPTEQFWMTIPVDIRQPRSRVDVFWYHGGVMRGSFTRDLSPGPVAVDQPFKTPVRMWGWPDALPKEQVYATSGDWTIHVVQDGAYLTSCRIAVRGHRFRGAGKSTRWLPCAPDRSDATADVRRRAAELRGYRIDPKRTREVMALHRSPETREVARALAMLDRYAYQTRMRSAVAAGDKETAATERQWKNAERRQKAAWSDEASADAEYRALRRRYDRLVAKHGR